MTCQTCQAQRRSRSTSKTCDPDLLSKGPGYATGSTTAEKIAVMQAFEEGKQIQCRNAQTQGNWRDNTSPAWDWWRSNYRVKPEPDEVYVVFNQKGNDVFTTKSPGIAIDAVARGYAGASYYKKFREVIEE